MLKIIDTHTKFNEKYGITEVFIYDDFGNSYKGKSRCNKEDEFNKDFGEKLAYFRAKQKLLKNDKKFVKSLIDRYVSDLEKLNNELNKVELITERVNSNITTMLKDAE